MPPTPTPVQGEIDTVREIARLLSYSDTEILVNALNDSQWSRMGDFISKWEALDSKDTKIINGLLGANVDPDRARLRITNAVREMLGLLPVNMAGISADDGYSQSIAVETVF